MFTERCPRKIHRGIFAAFVAPALILGLGLPKSIFAQQETPLQTTPLLPVGVDSQINVVYYPLYGQNIADLIAQAAQVGPIDKNDGSHEIGAIEDVTFYWHFDYLKDRGCKITNPQVSVKATELLPDWADADSADSSARNSWQTFTEDLRTHELGHVSILYNAAADMINIMKNQGTYRSCDTLGNKVNASEYDKLAEVPQNQEYYDKLTNHGASQGADIYQYLP